MELIDLVNSVINFLSQMILLRWFTFLLRSLTDFHSSALLDFFLSSDTSICSTMAFPQLGNSDHVVVSVSIIFSINSKIDAQFPCHSLRLFSCFVSFEWCFMGGYFKLARSIPRNCRKRRKSLKWRKISRKSQNT